MGSDERQTAALPQPDRKDLTEKIRTLLNNSDLETNERDLVALLLLARADDKTVESFLTPDLLNFCARLISSHDESSLYQLVSRLTCRIHESSNFKWDDLGKSLTQALKARLGSQIEQPDIELVDAIEHCLVLATDSGHMHAQILDVVWERFHLETLITVDQKTDCQSDGRMRFMIDLFERMLVQPDQQQISVIDRWNQSCLYLWQNHAPKLCSNARSTPSWYEPMVVYFTDKDLQLDSSFKTSWFGIMLLCTHILSLSGVWDPSGIAREIVDLITAHVSAPNSTIRLEAWQTCASVVSRVDWNRILQAGSPPGRGSQLALWTKLAVGEYRIQLGVLCLEDQPGTFDDTLIAACAQIIASAFQHAIELADTIDQESLDISSDQLLNMRHFFLDALHSTIQYLTMSTQPLLPACKLLCTLLNEFSIWTDLPAGVSTDDALTSIACILRIKVVEVFPCLVNGIFVLADDDDAKLKKVSKSKILGHVVGAIEHFWSTDPLDVNLVPWACKAAEYWWTLAHPAEEQTIPIARQILSYVTLQLEHVTSTNTSLVSVSVGCFVVLMGDRMPTERDALIIQKALAACEVQ